MKGRLPPARSAAAGRRTITHPMAPALVALDAKTVRISSVAFLVQRFADGMFKTLDLVLNHKFSAL
jgi:hypothetical protein